MSGLTLPLDKLRIETCPAPVPGSQAPKPAAEEADPAANGETAMLVAAPGDRVSASYRV